MKPFPLHPFAISGLAIILFSSGCSTPTLVQVARRRQVYSNPANAGLGGSHNVKDNVNVIYHITDLDVLNFTDEVKRKLANRSSFHMGVQYGSAGAEATLGALAGAAKVIGWGVDTASGLGLGATYIFGMGKIFDSKGHAQAYEQAFTAIQAAESTYYFHQLGMGFKKDGDRTVVDLSSARSRSDIPSDLVLTPDGESLYYRVSKILKVLADTLATKIPDLQDLKDAQGDSSGQASPAKPADAPAKKPADSAGSTTTTSTTTTRPASTTTATPAPLANSDVVALRDWWKPNEVVDPAHEALFNAWLGTNESSIDIASFLHNPIYKDDWSKARDALVK